MSSARLLLPIMLMAVLAPVRAVAQEGCESVAPTRSANVRGDVTYFGLPTFQCGPDTRISADTAIHRQATSTIYLWGSVVLEDGDQRLSADSATYLSGQGRLEGFGSVYVENREDGSIIRDGDLLLLRATADRPDELTVETGSDGIRPSAVVRPRASEEDPDTDAVDAVDPDAEPAPYTIVGDRIYFLGSDYFTSSGDVEIVRDSLFAFADEAEYDARGEGQGDLVLEGSARVRSSSYDLEGRTITVTSTEEGDEIRAVRDAFLVGDDLTVTSETIMLYLHDGELERLVAVPLDRAARPAPRAGRGPGIRPVETAVARDSATRPIARGETFELTGDSLDLMAPEGVVERILAAGTARSVSHARDSLTTEALPEVARADWMEGDTIIVTLRPVETASSEVAEPPGDAASGYEVEQIVARVNARSLYRLQPADTLARTEGGPPAVSYMVAQEITIHMSEGSAELVESRGAVRGVHLEPLRQDVAPPDSTSAPAEDGTDAATAAAAAADAARAAAGASQPDSSAADPTSTTPTTDTDPQGARQ